MSVTSVSWVTTVPAPNNELSVNSIFASYETVGFSYERNQIRTFWIERDRVATSKNIFQKTIEGDE